MLLRIPQVLTKQQVNDIRQIIDNADWADGVITAGSQSAKAKNNTQLPEDGDDCKKARTIVLHALATNDLYLTGALPKRIYPPLFNRYAGQKNAFGNHIDNSVRTHAATGRHVRTDVSCTLFLTEPEDYDGGELVITETLGEKRIKLPAGDMILYPSSTVHQVAPVTRGHRVSSFFWVESMVRGLEQRQLLFDMDMALLKLR